MDIEHRPVSSSLDLRIEYLPFGQLSENALNPRLHPARQIKALMRSISEFGFVTPVIVDEASLLVAGHGRVEAARKLGMRDIPVVRLAHLDQAQLRALMIADNRLTDMSHNDDLLLAENFKLLTVHGLSLDIEATGYSMGEIDLILDSPRCRLSELRTTEGGTRLATRRLWQRKEYRGPGDDGLARILLERLGQTIANAALVQLRSSWPECAQCSRRRLSW